MHEIKKREKNVLVNIHKPFIAVHVTQPTCFLRIFWCSSFRVFLSATQKCV